MLWNRQLWGNVCLVVLLTFFFTFVPGLPSFLGGDTGAALAATKTHDISFNTNLTPVQVKVTPVTSTNFVGYKFELKFKDQNGATAAIFSISINQTLDSSPTLLADNTTYGKVYGSVYNGSIIFDYYPADGVNVYSTGGWVYAYIYDNVYHSVYLDLQIKPPTPSGGGGGGGGGAAPPTTVDTETGELTIDRDKDLATLTVNDTKLSEEAKTEVKEIEIKIEADTREKKVRIPLSGFLAVMNSGKDLRINTGQVVILLPPQSLSKDELQALGEDVKVNLTVVRVPEEKATELFKNVSAAQQVTSKVFELNLKAVVGTGLSAQEKPLSLHKPVRVSFEYDRRWEAIADKRKLGAYRLNEDTGTWEYRRSWVADGRLVAELRGFSKYAVMLYEKTFSDIAGHWAKEDIELMASKHIVKGVDGRAFQPEGKVTRAQFAAMLQRMLGLPDASPAKTTFTDVAPGQWFYGAVEAAAAAGLVQGMGDGRFAPDDLITREQMAVMIARAAKASGRELPSGGTLGFGDAKAVSEWARDAVASAAKAGIIKGRTGNVFAPRDKATRAESSVMIRRLMEHAGIL